MVRTVDYYILEPVLSATGDVLTRQLADIRTELPDGQPTADPTVFVAGDKEFKQLESGQFIPLSVYDTVIRHSPGEGPPASHNSLPGH